MGIQLAFPTKKTLHEYEYSIDISNCQVLGGTRESWVILRQTFQHRRSYSTDETHSGKGATEPVSH